MVGLGQVPVDDAEQLGRRWGVSVAIEMLHDGTVSPKGFLWLCAEAADTVGTAPDHLPRPSHHPERSRACAAKAVEGRDSEHG
jgi:hypothetical protein